MFNATYYWSALLLIFIRFINLFWSLCLVVVVVLKKLFKIAVVHTSKLRHMLLKPPLIH